MARRMLPVCPRCRKSMKQVIYGLPSPADVDFEKYVYAGCIMDSPLKQWDCNCEVIPNRSVKFQIIVADITKLEVDVIVNAANQTLLAGGGVCGAIHRVAGRELEKYCLAKYPEGITTGAAVATPGFESKATWIVHAVAPRFKGEYQAGIWQLVSAYRNALFESDRVGAKSVAIPSLGTGIYGWSVEDVAHDVIQMGILETLPVLGNIETVQLCCFNKADFDIYDRALSQIKPDKGT